MREPAAYREKHRRRSDDENGVEAPVLRGCEDCDPRGLSDLPPVRLVERRSAVVEGTNGGEAPGRVANGGVLVTLGPIEGEGAAVEVQGSLRINGLAGAWLTYVVALQEREWRVTGTRGPVAIS